jgi:hypothetical protein
MSLENKVDKDIFWLTVFLFPVIFPVLLLWIIGSIIVHLIKGE